MKFFFEMLNEPSPMDAYCNAFLQKYAQEAARLRMEGRIPVLIAPGYSTREDIERQLHSGLRSELEFGYQELPSDFFREVIEEASKQIFESVTKNLRVPAHLLNPPLQCTVSAALAPDEFVIVEKR